MSGAGVVGNESDFICRNSIIADNTAPYGGGIRLENGCSPIITGCLITGNDAGQGGGIGMWGSSAVIDRCTIYGNHGDDAAAIRVIWIVRSFYSMVTNSIIAGNGAWVNNSIDSQPVNKVLTHNCFIWENTKAISFYLMEAFHGFGITNVFNRNGDPCDVYKNIFLEPLFVNANGNNFELQPNSPCIDAGDSLSENDPDLTVADMGAFPFSGVFTGVHLIRPIR